jgi:4'-phosphopantetheinyl transferase
VEEAITRVRTESLLKATGLGLSVDPTLVTLSAPCEPAVLREWRVSELPAPDARIYDLVLSEEHSAAVTVLAPSPVRLVVRHALRSGVSA